MAGLAGLVAVTAAPPATAAPVRVIGVVCDATSLATAIAAANIAPTRLRLASHCVYDITAQLPQITGAVAIVGGPSTAIRHDPATAANFRLIDVGPTGGLRVSDIYLRNGNPAGNGGGIRNSGRLVLERVTMNGNLAGSPLTAGGNGGALANLAGARALVTYSAISANEAVRVPAETTTGNGGGIDNAGDLTVVASRLVANNATGGPAVAGTGDGGGISTRPGGVSRVIQSTIAENAARNRGGGVFNTGATSLVHTLVLRNRAAVGGGVSGAVTGRRSIVRGNTPDNCSPAGPSCN